MVIVDEVDVVDGTEKDDDLSADNFLTVPVPLIRKKV